MTKLKFDCIFSNRVPDHFLNYSGKTCTKCKMYMWDLDSWHDVDKHIKKHYNLQRKDVAKILNLTPGTVSNYQCTWIGRLVKGLLEWHYKQQSQGESDEEIRMVPTEQAGLTP